MKLFKTYFFCIIVILFGCSDDDSNEVFPSEFTISVSDVGLNHAVINWSQSTDPNGSRITYDLFFNGKLITSKTEDLTYRFEELNENQMYMVEVIATNDQGNRTTSTLGFGTKENLPPTAFEILEAKNSPDDPVKIFIKWKASTDPEGGEIKYNLFVNGESKIWNPFSFPGMEEPEYTYSHDKGKILEGYVEAIDERGEVTKEHFSFENLYPTIAYQETDPDALTLSSQEEVNNFGNAGYKVIFGRLDIHESTSGSIRDLSPLKNIIHITEGLRIWGNTSLSSLKGLENLTNDLYHVSKESFRNLYIADNLALSNLEGLEELKNITTLEIINNGLVNLLGINQLKISYDIKISDNMKLEDISSLSINEGWELKGRIVIENNPSLKIINGFRNIKVLEQIPRNGNRIKSAIYIANNLSLKEIVGFSGGQNKIYPAIKIINNEQLLSIDGFTGISEADLVLFGTRNITIEDNPKLSSIKGFSGEDYAVSLEVKRNDELENLDFCFSGLTLADIVIRNNAQLKSINGLKDVKTADTKVIITHNPILINIEGLENLHNESFAFEYSVAQFIIENNNSLTSLKGLSNCKIFSAFHINYNMSLTDFCDINPEAQFSNIFTLQDNGYNPTLEDLKLGNCSL